MGMLAYDILFDHDFYRAEADLVFNTRQEALEHFLPWGKKLVSIRLPISYGNG